MSPKLKCILYLISVHDKNDNIQVAFLTDRHGISKYYTGCSLVSVSEQKYSAI